MITQIAVSLVIFGTALSYPFPENVPSYNPPAYHPSENVPAYKPPSYSPPVKHREVDPYNKDQYVKEPRPYAFDYGVRDDYTGANFGHQEDSDGNTIKGSYSVALPDGRIQKVNYVADEHNGFQAEVTYEGDATYPKYEPQASKYEDEQQKPHYQTKQYQPPKQQYQAPKQTYQPQTQYSNPEPTYQTDPRYNAEAAIYQAEELSEILEHQRL